MLPFQWHGVNVPLMETAPPTQQQIVDNEHVKLLSIFHYVLGGLTAFFGCFPIIHVAMGLFLILAPEKFGPGSQQPPAFMGWFFFILGGFFILVGWTLAILILLVGRFMGRRTRYSYCFVMACVECIFMPFGTVLGVFTIIALNRPTVKELFGRRPGI
jgi:hypothetical protein